MDNYDSYTSSLESPAVGIITITPDDNTDLPKTVRSIMVGEVGDVAVVMKDGTTGVLPALQPGVPYPVRVKRVLATGTTVTNMVGLY